MTVRFLDSCNHYDSADFTSKYTSITSTPTISAGTGRWGGNSLHITNYNQGASLTIDSQSTWFVGFGFRPVVVPNISVVLLTLQDAGTVHMDLRLNASGNLFITRNGTTLGSPGTSVLSSNVYHYLQFRGLIGDSPNGEATVKVDETTDITLTGVDTRNGVNASANQIVIASKTASGNAADFCDIYIADGNGGQTFLGDGRADTLFAIGAGNSTMMIPSTGSNFENIDDTTPDADSTYNSSSVVNDKDTYTYGNLTTPAGTIYAVQTLINAKKIDAGARTLAPIIRHDGTDYEGTSQALGASYIYYRQIFETNPVTTSGWAISDVNNDEFGVIVKS